jgi:hypothetical protein
MPQVRDLPFPRRLTTKGRHKAAKQALAPGDVNQRKKQPAQAGLRVLFLLLKIGDNLAAPDKTLDYIG